MDMPVEVQERAGEEDNTAKEANRSACEECGENPFKYKCPGCGLRSCSLPCVKAHKERTRCTGKRNRTQFVPLSQFDENWLISDYNLLEEVLRMTEAASRTRAGVGDSRPVRYMSASKKALYNEAKYRSTNLLLQPNGMSKNKINSSRFDKRRKCIYWTVEWQFHSTDVTFIDHRVDEHTHPLSILEKHLSIGPGNPLIRHKLRHFCNESIANLKLFVKKEYAEGDKKLYFEMNITEPLRFQLAYKTIIEYPVIHVVLPSNSTQFEVVKDLNPVPKNVVKPSKVEEYNDPGHLVGIPFREEEIEGEFEAFEDLNSVPERVVKPSNVGELNDLHLDHVSLRKEEIKEGEFEFSKGLNPYPEEVVNPSNVDKLDIVHLEDFPLREEEIEEGEIELTTDMSPVLEKVPKPSNFDELDDLVHLEDMPFREEEIEEGEFIPHQHFLEDFPLQIDIDATMDGVNDEII